MTDDVVVIPFNDVEAAERIIRANAADIAAVLLDAVPSYLGFVQATQRFTNMIERVTREIGALSSWMKSSRSGVTPAASRRCWASSRI